MADVNCPFCGEPVPSGVPLCPACGGQISAAATILAPLPGVAGQGPTACPRCAAPIPDPANLICVSCLEPFDRPDRSGAASPAVAATRRERPRTLVLDFPTGRVTVRPGSSVLLGRAPEAGACARVFRTCDNVSRHHASLGVEADGSAWVRDENSTNGTYINGAQVRAGTRTPLRDGDLLRLASDVEARVRLTEHAD